MVTGVAAGHPATVEAGIEILEAGGTAADAAVAACLASCVAETVMTGLLGGAHALYHEAGSAEVSTLDCFVTVPSGSGAPVVELQVPFGEEVVHYAIGISSCAVPGLPAGLDALWRRHGRLPWPVLVAPALRLARAGVRMPAAHASCLAMLEPVMTIREGARIYAPGGRLLQAGDRLEQPGLVGALELVSAEGGRSAYEGTLAAALVALMDERGGLVTAADLAGYEPCWEEPVTIEYAETTVLSRDALQSPLDVLPALPPLRAASPGERAVALVEALDTADRIGHTTNLTVVDLDGNACVLTSSLGLGSGDWLPGYDLHLNSMLGETDLLVGELEPGARMQSMMAPTLAIDAGGPVVAAGAAGGTRLRSALVQVLAGVLDEGLPEQKAVSRPRLHPAAGVVNVEPGLPEPAIAALEHAGYAVRRWPEPHHYFGGVSLVGRTGAAGDPRRSGVGTSYSP